MKKLTNKERAEIYLKAAELIENADKLFCCHAFEKAAYPDIYPATPDVSEKQAPELFLFQAAKTENGGWFGDTDIQANQEARINALLLARAMALNP